MARTPLDNNVGEDTKYDTLGDAAREGHSDHGDKAGQRIGEFGEVDLCDARYHDHATRTNAEAVATEGIQRKKGEKKRAERKNRATVKEVRPVRPPTATPVVLST